MSNDSINPDHYKSETSLECIEAMELVFGQKAVFDFCICNAWKYIWRWKNKNGIEDLDKANWYVKHACMYLDVLSISNDSHSMLSRMNDYISVQKYSLIAN